MTKKNKKGFTLTELIVVIAIIAILAAVLIPTSISFIQKAKQSADLQEVTSMNKILSYNALSDDVSYYNADDVEYLLCEQQEYTLVPRSKGYSYWYNRETNCIELIKDDELNGIFASDEVEYPNELEQLHPTQSKYLFVDKSSSDVREALDTIKNLVELSSNGETLKDTFEDVVQGLDENVVKHLNLYHPDTTLYIDSNGFYTSSDTSSAMLKIGKVIFTSKTKSIPAFNISSINNIEIFEGIIEIPKRIEIISDNSLTKLSDSVVINISTSNSQLLNKNNCNKHCSVLTTTNNKTPLVIGIYFYVKMTGITKFESGITYYTKNENNTYSKVSSTEIFNKSIEYYQQFNCPQNEIIYVSKSNTNFIIDNDMIKQYCNSEEQYTFEVKSYVKNVNIFEVIIYKTSGDDRGSIFARGIVKYITY